MDENIGMIGLGIMGKPMAYNLLQAGYALTVYNRSRAPVEALVSEGAVAAVSPSMVAQSSTIIITMLPGGAEVEHVVLGPQGVLEGARPGSLIIDMSTVAPVVAQRIAGEAAQCGVHMLDAPVSGGDVGARAGTLSIMVGGDADDVERAGPLFEVLGNTVTHCGEHGSGQIVKACNQVVVALTLEALAEALVLGTRAGVDPEVVLRVLSGGLAGSRLLELRGLSMIRHEFEPGGKAAFQYKDLGIALQLARECGAVVPVTAIVDQLYASLLEHGRGNLDHSAVLAVIEALSNTGPAAPPAPCDSTNRSP